MLGPRSFSPRGRVRSVLVAAAVQFLWPPLCSSCCPLTQIAAWGSRALWGAGHKVVGHRGIAGTVRLASIARAEPQPRAGPTTGWAAAS
jgi:hypothetical protein